MQHSKLFLFYFFPFTFYFVPVLIILEPTVAFRNYAGWPLPTFNIHCTPNLSVKLPK